MKLALVMTTSTIKKYASWLAFASLITMFIFGMLLMLLPHFINFVEWSYNLSGREFKEAQGNSLPYIYVGLVGALVGAIGIAGAITAIFANSHERKLQDTQNILLESRLSPYFQEQLNIRRVTFPVSSDPDTILDFYEKNKNSQEAAAVRYLLNYYEFLAIGIIRGNLEESMIKDSLRGIICTLVFDMRKVIHHIRAIEGKKKGYVNLLKIYRKWASETKLVDEWDEGFDFG